MLTIEITPSFPFNSETTFSLDPPSLSSISTRRKAIFRPSRAGLGTTLQPIKNPLSLRYFILFLTVSSSTPSFFATSTYFFFSLHTPGEPQSSLMRSEYALSPTHKRLSPLASPRKYNTRTIKIVRKHDRRLGFP